MSILVAFSVLWAGQADGWAIEKEIQKTIPLTPIATELLDPAGYTRFHLVTRALLSDGEKVISGTSTWAYEARLSVRLFEGFALTAVAPLSYTAGWREAPAVAYLGNVGFGATWGTVLSADPDLGIRFAAGVDIYLPTSPGLGEGALPRGAVAAARSYEPQLYLPKTVAGRGRALAELRTGALTAALELGLIPLSTLDRAQKGAAFLVASTGRLTFEASPSFEPYLEVGAATQLFGDGEIRPPLMITPGVRLHFADIFDPALFISINPIVAPAVIFGVDLATIIRPTRYFRPEPELGDTLEDVPLNF